MLVPVGDRIRAYPLEIWEEIEDRLIEEGRKAGESEAIEFIVGGAEECPLDKQGRVLLKPNIRKDGSIAGKDVMLTGLVKWFEIQDKESCEASLDAAKSALEGGLASLGRQGIF